MFNVTEFKSRLDAYGGPARKNLFFMEIYGSNSSYIEDEALRFFCKTVTMPGINLDTTSYNPRNFGMGEIMTTGQTPDPLSAIFIMDDNQRVMSFFHEWMQQISNYDTSQGLNTGMRNNSDHLPYELGYKDDYSKNMVIRQFSIGNRPMQYVCELTKVFPIQISPIDLSWEDNNTYSTLSVNFSYKNIRFSANMSEYEESRRARSGIDYFRSIGDVATMSVNDLVNAETRISTGDRR